VTPALQAHRLARPVRWTGAVLWSTSGVCISVASPATPCDRVLLWKSRPSRGAAPPMTSGSPPVSLSFGALSLPGDRRQRMGESARGRWTCAAGHGAYDCFTILRNDLGH
jgi:hypothetical protein